MDMDKQTLEDLKEKDAQGDAEAQYQLGMYSESRRDYRAAREYYKKAAKKGNHKAETRLGILFHEGYGTNINDEIALYWFKRAANAKSPDPLGEYYMGLLCETGVEAMPDGKNTGKYDENDLERMAESGGFAEREEILKPDGNEAVKWYQKAAEGGCGEAMERLGELYCHGMYVDKDPGRALELFEKAADMGMKESAYMAALMLDAGEGCQRDEAKALERLRQAAEMDHRKAQTAYGQKLAAAGQYADALRWFEKAAGYDTAAKRELGDLYLNGHGVKKDEAKAFEYFRSAAEDKYAPDPIAQLKLGMLCYLGIGCEQDSAKAGKLIMDSFVGGVGITAAQGIDDDIRDIYGVMCEHGFAVEKQPEKAYKYYSAAGGGGNVNALYNAGRCFYYGIGKEKNNSIAKNWLTSAAEKGHAEAKKLLDKILFEEEYAKKNREKD